MIYPNIMTELQIAVIENYENKNKQGIPLSWYEEKVNYIIDKEMLPALKAANQFPSQSSNGGKVVVHVRHKCADIADALRKECDKYFAEVQGFYGDQEAYRMVKEFDTKLEGLNKTADQWWQDTRWDCWYHEDTKTSIKLKDHLAAIKINEEVDKTSKVKGIIASLSEEDIAELVSSGLKI